MKWLKPGEPWSGRRLRIQSGLYLTFPPPSIAILFFLSFFCGLRGTDQGTFFVAGKATSKLWQKRTIKSDLNFGSLRKEVALYYKSELPSFELCCVGGYYGMLEELIVHPGPAEHTRNSR